MRTERVSDHVWWVGAIDWNLRDFHGFETPRGTTYNAYLVKGEHTTALVDTVKTPFVGELLSRVASLVDPASIGLIVVNHVEPDHNMGLPDVMAACPNASVVASGSGVRGVAEYHDGLVVEAVGDKDVIDLGGVTLRFLPMPMVHWPDSMFTYCSEERVLMCNDAFGQHLATAERFADEVGEGLALDELGRYYANILMPVSAQVSKVVDKVHAAGWEPLVVAPSHGVMWRGEAVSRATWDSSSFIPVPRRLMLSSVRASMIRSRSPVSRASMNRAPGWPPSAKSDLPTAPRWAWRNQAAHAPEPRETRATASCSVVSDATSAARIETNSGNSDASCRRTRRAGDRR